MMDFSQAWESANVGDYLTVSDGIAMPSLIGGMPWRCWRSHNFTGRLVDKVDGQIGRRAMRFELAPHGRASIAYTIHETGGHSFAVSDYDTFASDVFDLL
jgi:hypothetical protein